MPSEEVVSADAALARAVEYALRVDADVPEAVTAEVPTRTRSSSA
jgi:hypothetical protein